MGNRAPHCYFSMKAITTNTADFFTLTGYFDIGYIINTILPNSIGYPSIGKNNWGENDIVSFEVFASIENDPQVYFPKGDIVSIEPQLLGEGVKFNQPPLIFSNHGTEGNISQSFLVYKNIFTFTNGDWRTDIASKKNIAVYPQIGFRFLTIKPKYVGIIIKGTYLGTLVNGDLVYNP